MPKKVGKKNNRVEPEAKLKKETETEQLARLRALAQSRGKAQSWFYLAIGSLTAVIIIFWGYSMYSRLTSFELRKTDESELMAENKKTWKEIFETVSGKNSTDEIKTKLQTVIMELKKAAETATTTVATTTTETTTETAATTTASSTLILSPTTTNNP